MLTKLEVEGITFVDQDGVFDVTEVTFNDWMRSYAREVTFSEWCVLAGCKGGYPQESVKSLKDHVDYLTT